ncbi:MAG: ABC transporter ATP-binding protein, partial [Pseudomonadota bacterium]
MFRHFERIIDPFASQRLDQPPTGLLAFYARFIGQARGPVVVSLVAGGLLAVLNALVFVFVGDIVDRLEAASTPAAFFAENAQFIAMIAVLLLVVDPLLAFITLGALNQALVPGFTNLIRWQMHRYVLRQSVSYFQNDFAGRLANKVMQTSLAVRRSINELIDAIWHALIFVITTFVVLLEADWRLALPLAAWFVGYVVLLRIYVPRIKQYSEEQSETYSNLMGRVVDSYSNILTVKLFGNAAREDAFAREGMTRHQRQVADLMRQISWLDVSIGIWNMVMVFAVGWIAITLWSVGDLTVGVVATALALALRVNQMSFWIMFVTTSVAENIGVVRDGIDTISVPQEVVDTPDAGTLAVPRGEIRLDAVSFHYGQVRGEKGAVIDDLSLTIRPGERVGLVGRSGAGKSTLVQLLLRLHDVEGGRILIDGTDIAGVRQESLREQIGMVTQDTSLLHRS